MKTTRHLLGVIAVALSSQAEAAVTFTFDNIALSGNTSFWGATAGASNIQTGMNAQLAAGGYNGASVSVSGAIATGSYNGEGHVVGPTLGPDTFLANDGLGIRGSASNSFTLTFVGLLVTAISFDWEIFPNASCQANTYCATHSGSSSFPDLTVNAGATQIFHVLANLGSSTLDPQGIGTSGLINIAGNGVTSLTFIDWPAEIGIDNLRIVTSCPRTNPQCGGTPTGNSSVPEPSTWGLMGLGFAVLALATRRRRSAAPAALA